MCGLTGTLLFEWGVGAAGEKGALLTAIGTRFGESNEGRSGRLLFIRYVCS